MSIELNRSAFEAFAQRNEFGTYRTDRKGDGYDSSHTQLMWMAWCAAIQQAESEPAGAREALERIASWSEHPAMLGVDYGSNGVRDYYRKIARDALTHPAQGVPDDVARDAERYRFIRDADVSDDLIPDIALYAMESLDEYIDAAMLAAHPAQKGD